MNHRERILAALRHEEPDRVPIDLGGTCDSTIMAVSYQDLRQGLGLPPSTTRVVDIYQQTAVIEEDVRQALGVDAVSIFGAPQEWRQGNLADGSPAELPAKFQPQVQTDGSRVVLDAQGHVVAKMPAGGPYFDPLYAPLADATSVREIEDHLDEIVNYDMPAHLDKSYKALAEDAQALRENTDYALVGFFGGHLLQAGQVLRGWETFLMDLLVDKKFAHALLSRLLDAHLARLARYAATVGPYLDVLHFEEDLGSKTGR
jgi:uroporphyrinogen decarboxylase